MLNHPEIKLVAFPTPTNNITLIRSNYLVNEISLTNILGKVVISNKNVNSNHVNINLTDLPNNIYFVKVKTKYGVKSIKILKE